MDKPEIIIETCKAAGSGAALARQLGITRAAVSAWKKVPAEHVLAVERITGISRYALRPDVFGPWPVMLDAAPEPPKGG